MIIAVSSSRDNCGGYLNDPLIEFRCKQVIRKWPQQVCNTLFTSRESQRDVCKTYCERHRYCFLPLVDKTRCPNYRRSVDKLYCSIHTSQERQCGSLVGQYKKQCGDNPLTQRCSRNDTLDLVNKKLNLFNNCREGRMIHHTRCVHPSVQSSGHLYFLRSVGQSAMQCVNMLPTEVWDNSDSESASSTSSRSTSSSSSTSSSKSTRKRKIRDDEYGRYNKKRREYD